MQEILLKFEFSAHLFPNPNDLPDEDMIGSMESSDWLWDLLFGGSGGGRDTADPVGGPGAWST